jgi:glutathione S-transferase
VAEPITLYVVPASHPCVAVMAGLKLKGLDYERKDLMFGVSNLHQLARFGARTVPGLKVGRQRVVGSRLILRTIDGLAPESPLVPTDAEHRAAVDEADEWGDLVLQEQVRWIALQAMKNAPDALPSFMEGYGVPALPPWARKQAGLGVDLEMRLLGYSADQVHNEWTPALPGHIDHIDSLIEKGIIGGDQPNVADLQISATVRMLLNLEDLRPAIEDRPAGKLARRLIPDYPGHLPAGALRSPF